MTCSTLAPRATRNCARPGVERPPPLPYAPRRSRPLSLWNPLDYLLLLYWVFFFPQALRWYVESFGRLPADTALWQAVRDDSVQRRLAVQGLLVTVIAAGLLILVFNELDYSVTDLAVGVAVGVTLGVAFVVLVDLVRGMTRGVTLGVALVVALGVTGVTGGVVRGMARGMARDAIGTMMVPLVGGVMGAVVGTVANGLASGVAYILASGAAIGVAFVVALGVMGVALGVMGVALGVMGGAAVGAAVGVAFGVIALRFDAALLGWLAGLPGRWIGSAAVIQRASPLPVYGLRRLLARRLAEDWMQGLRECEGLLR